MTHMHRTVDAADTVPLMWLSGTVVHLCSPVGQYLILKGVMDEEWLQAANAAVDSIEHTATTSSELSGGAPNLEGGPQTRISGLLDLPQPHRASFERMMAHPAVQHRLAGWADQACVAEWVQYLRQRSVRLAT